MEQTAILVDKNGISKMCTKPRNTKDKKYALILKNGLYVWENMNHPESKYCKEGSFLKNGKCTKQGKDSCPQNLAWYPSFSHCVKPCNKETDSRFPDRRCYPTVCPTGRVRSQVTKRSCVLLGPKTCPLGTKWVPSTHTCMKPCTKETDSRFPNKRCYPTVCPEGRVRSKVTNRTCVLDKKPKVPKEPKEPKEPKVPKVAAKSHKPKSPKSP